MPTSANQASPGSTKTAARNGNGIQTSTPTKNAVRAERDRRGTPDTTAQAPTYDAVAATAPASGTISSVRERSNPVTAVLRRAAGTPISRAARQCAPYSLIVSATSCPTVRVAGGSGGGGGPELFG
jgi:hypothetical protein